MPTPMRIETPRLVLRDFEEDDWRAIHAYAVLEAVWRNMEWGPNTEADTKNFVARARALAVAEPRTWFELAIARKETGAVIGAVGVRVRDPSARAGDLGYALHPDAWGQGFATEAARAVRDLGFGTLGLHRLHANCWPENPASARVLEKIGMRFEGRLRHVMHARGAWRDTLLFAMVESDPRPG